MLRIPDNNKMLFGGFFILGIIAFFFVIPYDILLKIDQFNYFAFLGIFIASITFLTWFSSGKIKSFLTGKSKKDIIILFVGILLICGLNLFLLHHAELTGRKTMFSSLFENDINSVSPRSYLNIITIFLESINLKLSIYELATISRIISMIVSATIFLVLCRFINRYLSFIITIFISMNNKFIYASTSYEIAIISSVLFMCLAILFFDMYVKSRLKEKDNNLLYIAFISSAILSAYCKVEMIFFLIIPIMIYLFFEKWPKKDDELKKKINIIFATLSLLMLIVFIYQCFTLPKEYSGSNESGTRNVVTILSFATEFLKTKFDHQFMVIKLIFAIAALVMMYLLWKVSMDKKNKDRSYLTGVISSSILFLYLSSYFVFMVGYIPVQYVIFPIVLITMTFTIFSKVFLKNDFLVMIIVILAIMLYGLWNSDISPDENMFSGYQDIMRIGNSLDDNCKIMKYQDNRYPYFDFIIEKKIKSIRYSQLFGDGTFMENDVKSFLDGKCYYIFIFNYSGHMGDDVVPELSYQREVLNKLIGMDCVVGNKYNLLFENKDARLLELRC